MTEIEQAVRREFEDKQNQMLEEAALLHRSIAWTELEIQKKSKELESAQQSFDYDAEASIRKELSALLIKLNKEVEHTYAFMEKHRDVILKSMPILPNEKEKSLLDSWKEKQVHLRSIPAHARGKEKSGTISRNT